MLTASTIPVPRSITIDGKRHHIRHVVAFLERGGFPAYELNEDADYTDLVFVYHQYRTSGNHLCPPYYYDYDDAEYTEAGRATRSYIAAENTLRALAGCPNGCSKPRLCCVRNGHLI